MIEKEQRLKINERRDYIKEREIENVRLFKTNNMRSEIPDEIKLTHLQRKKCSWKSLNILKSGTIKKDVTVL